MQNPKAANSKKMKENNLSSVLRCIRADSNSSRVSIARKIGLTQATITNIVNQLISWGIVSEQESIVSSEKGRRPVRLVLNSEKYLTYSARINRDYLCIGLYDIAGTQLDIKTCPISPGDSAEAVINQIQVLLSDLHAHTTIEPLALGIALPGPFNAGESRIALMSHFPGWEKLNLAKELEQRINLPVFLDHDANCCALAEQWYGANRECKNVIYVLADRGVGAGLILDGSIYHGAQGFAGEIGHVSINMYGPLCECGNRGCLEMYCSMIALENEYKREYAERYEIADDYYVPASQILARVRDGSDLLAYKVYERIVGNLAFGMSGIINIINPELIIFADKIIEGGDCFLKIMRSALKQHILDDIYSQLEISTSTVDGDPVMLGASILAFDHILQTPTSFFS